MNKLILLATALTLVACNQETVKDEKTSSLKSTNPYITVSPKLDGNLPLDVVFSDAKNLTTEQDRPFFDHYSWQTFIALNWPADISNRGVPIKPNTPDSFLSTNRSGETSSPVVWETYREGFELFPPNDTPTPPPWNSSDPSYSPAGNTHDGKRVFAMTTKGGLMDEINEAFGGPLIDQNKKYVRYEVRINETEYEQVRTEKWYDKPTLEDAIAKAFKESGNEGIQFKNNSIELKAAWREMVEGDDLSKYYVVNGLIADAEGNYSSANMGLVGLHIMQKTEKAPQWIWSTFEHVDNVTGIHPSFNNGSDAPTTPLTSACKEKDGVNPSSITQAEIKARGYDCEPFEIPPFVAEANRRPVQVTRVDPIPTTPAQPAGYSTQALNTKYQKLVGGTVWENYELVSTQWPTNPELPSPYDPTFDPDPDYKPELAGNPFPEFSANLTMETYFQKNSCMQCHYHAAAYGTDYSWIMVNRVIPPEEAK
ncbi:MAG: hypothetical protein ABJO36_04805 [Litorimonas sp.]